MRRMNPGKVAFAAAVALMLGFGAREALSAPPAPAKAAISCEDDEQCQSYCEFRYPNRPVEGYCHGAPFGHCDCIFL